MTSPSKGNRFAAAAFSESAIAMALSHVDRRQSSECWTWTGSKDRKGYGLCSVSRHTYRAHRVAYAAAFGEVPAGVFVCHRCDNPSCCNPAHLFLGTTFDNMADKVAKGRQTRGPKHAALAYERSHKGSASRNAKLTEAIAVDIRLRKASGESTSALARAYSVSRAAINNVFYGRSWRHV